MISLLRAAAFSCTIFVAASVSAQCPSVIDITLVPNQENQVEVWLRPQADFDQFFSSIVFTLRWMDSDGANLGSVMAQPPFGGLGTSGPEHVDGMYRYQIYSGIDVVNFAGIPEMFMAGQEMLFAKINVLNGSSFFEIADDPFTDSMNGTYYVSLNGQSCSGESYTFSTGVLAGTAAPEVSISPNPTADRTTVDIALTVQADLNFELFDPAGRRIWQQARSARTGHHREQIDLEDLAEGIYMLQVRIGDRLSTHRLVLSGAR